MVGRVHGVVGVNNNLHVGDVVGFQREDTELRGDVVQALMLDLFIPLSIEVSVNGGCVALTGTVDGPNQRAEAEFVAGNVPGVTAVQNLVQVRNPGSVKGAGTKPWTRT